MSNDHEGDRHYWRIWHAKKPITEYNRQRSRFFSEYGFQSFPCFETVKRYAPLPGDQDITSEVMMSHQRGGEHANNLIKSYLLNEYHEPRDFESFLYASQILQGDAIKTAIEAHRRDQGLLLGIALLAAQRLLAGSFVVEPRLVRRLEGAALLRPLRIRRHTDLPDPRRRTARHLRRFRPAHSGERHLVRSGGASDGRPDRGVRTADRRPGQRQHESRRHRHPDAAERSRSGRGRHSGDIHRCRGRHTATTTSSYSRKR